MKKNFFKDIINIITKLLNKLVPKREVDFLSYFNTPIKYIRGDWYVSERIIEQAYVLNNIEINDERKRILDFGCARNYMPLQIASLGHEVVGIDLRNYYHTHPKFQFYQTDILEFKDKIGFDYIISISVLEHVGLGFYGKRRNQNDLGEVALKLVQLLKKGGSLIITVPVGKKYEDRFLKSFSHEEITSLFSKLNLELIKHTFFRRSKFKIWNECGLGEIKLISNSAEDRGPTGVNGIGCYIWKKSLTE